MSWSLQQNKTKQTQKNISRQSLNSAHLTYEHDWCVWLMNAVPFMLLHSKPPSSPSPAAIHALMAEKTFRALAMGASSILTWPTCWRGSNLFSLFWHFLSFLWDSYVHSAALPVLWAQLILTWGTFLRCSVLRPLGLRFDRLAGIWF